MKVGELFKILRKYDDHVEIIFDRGYGEPRFYQISDKPEIVESGFYLDGIGNYDNNICHITLPIKPR